MNEQRTSHRRLGLAWPLFTGVATLVAAAVLVISLGLSDGGSVGSGPTPSAGSSSSPESSATPDASATNGPAASGEGEFGPIHSISPEDAFANAQTCTVRNAIVNAESTDFTWSVAFPAGWSTNGESTELRSACTLFGPERFEAPDDQAIPEAVAIVTDVPPGGDFVPDGASLTSQVYTVDGVAAIRSEIAAGEGGFAASPSVVWIIAIAGNLPNVGNDQPYLAFQTSSDDPDDLAALTIVLDRMVATLDIGV